MVFSQWNNIHRIFKRLAKALIRLRVCAGWSEPMLVAHTTVLGISCHGSIMCIIIRNKLSNDWKSVFNAAPNKGTTILYWFIKSPLTEIRTRENNIIHDHVKAFGVIRQYSSRFCFEIWSIDGKDFNVYISQNKPRFEGSSSFLLFLYRAQASVPR